MFEPGMSEQRLGCEALLRPQGDIVPSIVQSARSRRAYGSEGQIASLVEKGVAEPHGIGAGEYHEAEGIERSDTRARLLRIAAGLYLDRRQKQRGGTLRLQ